MCTRSLVGCERASFLNLSLRKSKQMASTNLFEKLCATAIRKVPGAVMQMLVGGGVELCVYESSPGLAELWESLCRSLSSEAQEGELLKMLHDRIRKTRGPLAAKVNWTQARSRFAVERDLSAIAKRLDALIAEVKQMQAADVHESRDSQNRLYRVAFPATTLYVHGRSVEQAIDHAADKMISLAKAHDWPDSLQSIAVDNLGRRKFRRK